MPPESRIADGVLSYALPAEETANSLFAELSASAHLEAAGKGRRGAVLTRVDATGGVPLVRTTTRYSTPAQRFRPVHERLAQRIQERSGLPTGFNNALFESYTNAYRTMGAHSDQALDLADDSHIAVFSCYRNPEAGSPRKLVFASKDAEGETFEIPLTHNSVVTFSVASNRRLKHKIVLDAPGQTEENEWLGLTFRTSKTPVRFHDDGHACLPQGARLALADDEQRSEFYRLRRRENQEADFAYPPLTHMTYTISESDLMPPI
ncbi:alpha-ketoglutarate-dependent dioxygenase AlkB [Streptomyces sp. Ju416(a)]|uniref:alpha-ketoglutarate-dependent dioxygenase AlkB n=1 Tax=Streptomyces sp. Ju416(a) TaxID=3446591 RepID=UPI00403DF522